MINTIILDIGNVLARFGWREYFENCGYDEETMQGVINATVMSKFWKEWDRGSREETEIIEQCINHAPQYEKEIKAYFDTILTLVQEYDYTEEFVKRLKENGYKLYLLSNYNKWHFENDSKRFQFMNYVDGGIISYQVQHVKPEPEIYEALIRKYDIKPEEAVFMDDLQENLDGAKVFGFHTILVQSHEQTLLDLRKLGVKI